jgi:CDP-paratose 2-epimerase
MDFEVNALGTLNILEAMRETGAAATLIYSSTNKVYGEMTGERVVERNNRYSYENLSDGIAETQPLDFHSPYGCSKGSADQYVIDYHRIYGLKTVVFRQSCIYGYRQFGAEDQGWVAWFMIANQLGRPVKIYGDGKQVRDILFIDDLLDGYDCAFARPDAAAGQAFNVGGGKHNVLSLLELVDYIGKRQGRSFEHGWDEWRPGDQKIFVSDIRKAEQLLGWQPRTSCQAGLTKLYDWVRDNTTLFQ